MVAVGSDERQSGLDQNLSWQRSLDQCSPTTLSGPKVSAAATPDAYFHKVLENPKKAFPPSQKNLERSQICSGFLTKHIEWLFYL